MTRLLWIPVRLVALVLAFPAMLASMLLIVLGMAWWQLVGALAAPFGAAARKMLGRYLGCMPFTWLLVHLFFWAAVVTWGSSMTPVAQTISKLADRTLVKLADEKGLRDIGGLW